MLCWARIWLCWARWLGVGFGRAGRAGLGLGVRFGCGGRAGLGWACVWSTLYMSSSSLHDVFVLIFMCISDV